MFDCWPSIFTALGNITQFVHFKWLRFPFACMQRNSGKMQSFQTVTCYQLLMEDSCSFIVCRSEVGVAFAILLSLRTVVPVISITLGNTRSVNWTRHFGMLANHFRMWMSWLQAIIWYRHAISPFSLSLVWEVSFNWRHLADGQTK